MSTFTDNTFHNHSLLNRCKFNWRGWDLSFFPGREIKVPMTIYANLLGRFQMRVLEDTFTEEKKKWDESRKAVLKLLEMLCSTWNSCKRPKGHNTTQHECLWKAWEKWKKSWQKTKISKGIVHTRLYNIIILIRWKWALTYLNNYQDYLILLRKKKK